MTRSPVATTGLLIALVISLAAVVALAACTARQDRAASDAQGVCASCHGLSGISHKEFTPHLAGQNYAYIVKQLRYFRATVQNGDARTNATMEWHARHIDDADIEALARYYADQTCARGTYTWLGGELNNACTACHGVNGRSADPEIPNLAGQKVSYMKRQLLSFQNSADGTANGNPHISRASARMARAVDDMRSDELNPLYYFNAQGCR